MRPLAHQMTRNTLFAICCLAPTTLLIASAEADSRVYVIHGIRGQDLGAAPGLPVDVCVNGECLLTGFTFGTIAGPLPLPAGEYAIEISPANPSDPGTNDPVISQTVNLGDRQDVTIVAHLDGGGEPIASLFENGTEFGTQAAVRHTAAAPNVDIRLLNLVEYLGFRIFGRLPGPIAEDLANAEQAGPLHLRAGFYFAVVSPSGSTDIVLGPKFLFVAPFNLYNVHAVGTVNSASNTLTLVVQRIRSFGNDHPRANSDRGNRRRRS